MCHKHLENFNPQVQLEKSIPFIGTILMRAAKSTRKTVICDNNHNNIESEWKAFLLMHVRDFQ
jgi:hypothetical protein